MPMTDRGLRSRLIHSFAGKLRFPQLFALVAVLFVADLVVPDVIPFADEILLGLLTLLLGTWKAERGVEEEPVVKNVTPPGPPPGP